MSDSTEKILVTVDNREYSGFYILALVAGYLSWTTHHNALWCIIHSLCSGVYIVYWLFTNQP